MRVAVLLCAAFLSVPAWAASLSSLISTADAIVVGTESSAVQSGATVAFYLNVERVFTGDIPEEAMVNVAWHARRAVGMPDGSPSYRGIWFLHKGADGNWECTSAGASGNAEFFPDLSLPVADGPLPAQLAYDSATTSLTDQIALESVAGKPRSNPMMLLDVLAGTNSPGTLRAFRYLAASQSRDMVFVGLTGLIQAGDTGGLLSAEAIADAKGKGIDRIASAIKLSFRSSDPAAIASLGRMATAGKASPLMQDAAAQALTALHSAATVPWLGLLLNSSSASMQLEGARGLSYFANGVGIPTPQTMPALTLNQRQASTYRTSETERYISYKPGDEVFFIQFWQDWWKGHPGLH